jgi:hypothetical protein
MPSRFVSAALALALALLAASFIPGSTNNVAASTPLRSGWLGAPLSNPPKYGQFFIIDNNYFDGLRTWKTAHSDRNLFWFVWACNTRSDADANFKPENGCLNSGALCYPQSQCNALTRARVARALDPNDLRNDILADPGHNPPLLGLDGIYIDWEPQTTPPPSTTDTLMFLTDLATMTRTAGLSARLWTNAQYAGSTTPGSHNGLTYQEGDAFDVVSVMLNHPAPGGTTPGAYAAYLDAQLAFWKRPDGTVTSAGKTMILQLHSTLSTCSDADLAINLQAQGKISNVAIWMNNEPVWVQGQYEPQSHTRLLAKLGLAAPPSNPCP